MEKLCTVSKNKTGSWLWLRSWTPYCQIQTEIEESRETTSPFKYDLNQIPYDYTAEVTNRFEGIRSDRQSAWRNMDKGLWYCTGDRNQDHHQEKEMQKSNMAVWGGLINSCGKKRSKKQRRKWKIFPFAEFQGIARRDKKAFLNDQCKEIEENNRMGKTRDLFKKIRDIKGTFNAKMGTKKERNCMNLTEEVARIHRTTQKRSSRLR